VCQAVLHLMIPHTPRGSRMRGLSAGESPKRGDNPPAPAISFASQDNSPSTPPRLEKVGVAGPEMFIDANGHQRSALLAINGACTRPRSTIGAQASAFLNRSFQVAACRLCADAAHSVEVTRCCYLGFWAWRFARGHPHTSYCFPAMLRRTLTSTSSPS
jgi:hypothetical protein